MIVFNDQDRSARETVARGRANVQAQSGFAYDGQSGWPRTLEGPRRRASGISSFARRTGRTSAYDHRGPLRGQESRVAVMLAPQSSPLGAANSAGRQTQQQTPNLKQ